MSTPDRAADSTVALDAAPADGEASPPAPASGAVTPTDGAVRDAAWLKYAALTIGAFAIAIAIRAWIVSQRGLGLVEDLDLFLRWTRGLTERGLSGFYQPGVFCDYPPLMLLLFRGVGAAATAWADGEVSGHSLTVGIKSLACAGDLLIGALLLIEGRRLLGPRGGLFACAAYLLNPVALYDSAYWGQMDSIYTAGVLAALTLVGRRRCLGAGAAAGAALAAKFQSIAILPLVVFEAFRLAGWRGLRNLLAGAVLALAAVATPFLATGTLREVVDRAYVHVVGQYHEMSKNAFNIWHLLDDPTAPDVAPPLALTRLVAGGRDRVQVEESWLLQLTWRRISLAIFALVVAVVLSIYAWRAGPVARFGAAGLLALCFFLFPTEMHERYAYPAVALLAIWAAARPANERVYWIFTLLLTLNLTAVLPVKPLSPQIAVAMLGVFGVLLMSLGSSRREAQPADDAPTTGGESADAASTAWLIPTFQAATAAALLAAVGLAVWIGVRLSSTPAHANDSSSVWLSELTPARASQGWKQLARDRAVSGTPMRLGDTFYLRGVGTHAPAFLVYDVPAEAVAFEAIVGVDRAAHRHGSIVVVIELDGRQVFESPVLRGSSDPLPIRLPVKDARKLTIHVKPTPDGQRADHADLALARFVTSIQSE